MDILSEARKVFVQQQEAIIHAGKSLNDSFITLVNIILQCKGHVIVMGVGKSGHIGTKIAATMSSIGTPSFFVHPGEALHGDLGMITKNDIVIVLSKSGESDEVSEILPSIKKIGAAIVAVTCKDRSSLSANASLHIKLDVGKEAYDEAAPTSSTTAMLVFGDSLAIVLSKLKGFSSDDYAVFHPRGALGKKLLLRVDSIMCRGDDLPVVNINADVRETVLIMSSAKLIGGVSVIDNEGKLVGVFTDGNLRRYLASNTSNDAFTEKISNLMTRNPITIRSDSKVTQALELMERNYIGLLPCVDENDNLVGMIHLYDIIRTGIV